MPLMRTATFVFVVSTLLPGVGSGAGPPQQAVIETSAGTIVWDLLADKAPSHVALFIKTAQAGGFDGTGLPPDGALRHRPGRRSR